MTSRACGACRITKRKCNSISGSGMACDNCVKFGHPCVHLETGVFKKRFLGKPAGEQMKLFKEMATSTSTSNVNQNKTEVQVQVQVPCHVQNQKEAPCALLDVDDYG
jgi:hypothetical protein